MADWNQPTNASAYTGVLSTLNEKVANTAKMDFTGDTNVPTGAIRHDGATNRFQEWNGSSWVDLTVNFGGNIGIGENAPGARLQINTGAAATKGAILRAFTSQTANLLETHDSTGVVLLAIDASGDLLAVNGTASVPAVSFNSDTNTGLFRPGADVLAITTNGSERIRVDANGNMGINNNNPGVRLKIGNGSAIEGVDVDGSNSGTSGGAYYVVKNAGTNVCGIGNFSALFGGGYNGTSTLWSNAVGWRVTNLGTGAGTHAMRYDTGSGAWTYDTSSARYKKDITDLPYGLDSVLALQPRSFKYKDSDKADVGFIAEEVVEVIPEIVPMNLEGQPDAVSYDRLTSVLCKAIQELAARVEALEAE